MRVAQQDKAVMELRSERSGRDLVLLSLVGIIAPLMGFLILLSRQDVIALFVGIALLFGLTLLFAGVPESLLFDKTNDRLVFLRKRPIGYDVYNY